MTPDKQLGRRRSVNIEIQTQTSVKDASGQLQPIWGTICSLQGRIRAVRQNEAFQSNQFTSQVSHVIEAWWTAISISAGMRAIFGSRTLLIQSVENVEQRNKEILIFCLELNGPTVTVTQ